MPREEWLARETGEIGADFGDGLRLTATVRDVGRTKQNEGCLDRGERANGPLSPGADIIINKKTQPESEVFLRYPVICMVNARDYA